MIRKVLLGLVVAAVSIPAGDHAHAAKFVYASQGDPRTLDPHAMNEQLTLSIQTQIYDTLVGRGKNLELVPSLATSWENTGGATWRFTLRQGVKFHEGQDFTAEDVAFSIERGKPGSQFRAFLAHITDVIVVDDFTIDVTTAKVDPLLPGKLSTLNIMDRDWAIAHDSETVSDIGADAEEIHATRHANGTGPYRLRLREPGIRTELVRNDEWWGENEGNVTEATYLQITSAPTRVAALLSGEVDMIMDAPLQDLPRIQSSPDLKVLQGPEIRTLLIGMDQHRDQPLHAFDAAGNALASNPFKDLRVRQAVAHAINVDALIDRVLRGNGVPAGIVSIPGLNGYDAELDRRPAFALDRARSLMSEAGWGDGFRIGFLCPNNRYVNDTEVCRAIAGQLAQINIKAEVDSVPRNVYFSRLLEIDTSFYIIGLTASAYDTFDLLQSNLMTREPPDGQVNFGRWSNADYDAAVNALKSEIDPAKRRALYERAITLARDDLADLRLYHQAINWAMKSNVDATLRSDNFVHLKWITVD